MRCWCFYFKILLEIFEIEVIFSTSFFKKAWRPVFSSNVHEIEFWRWPGLFNWSILGYIKRITSFSITLRPKSKFFSIIWSLSMKLKNLWFLGKVKIRLRRLCPFKVITWQFLVKINSFLHKMCLRSVPLFQRLNGACKSSLTDAIQF